MKLLTRKGEIELPIGFLFNMERNNPLLSGEGDASIPASLPSSSRNLFAIGHRERIDLAEKYVNKMDAMLEVGPIRKHGQLVLDTVHRRNGIDASFAIDNSDLYVKSKNKTLKEIFFDYKIVFGEVSAAMEVMQRIYEGADSDFKVFPVAVSPYEDNGEQIYQYNNRVVSGSLVYETTIHEKDSVNSVPPGYGIAPFLKLSRLMELLFQILGYEVTENCLTDWPYQRLVIVHNCSDCLCNPTVTLFYRDLVPSCTLSDFLTWLCNKFHVQPVVDSNNKHVRIVAMETMLAMGADMDITPILEGDFSVQHNPSKRVVLTPTNSIEGTEPAAATFDKLIEKYGDFAYATEEEYYSLDSASPEVNAALVLRRATGQFYAVDYDSNLQQYVSRLLGTNHFTYDRANSDETEEMSQTDSIPLMLCGLVKPRQTLDVVPFIGERQHAHTSYNNSTADDKQDIIVVQAATDEHLFYTTTGTTQPVIPYAAPENEKYYLELGFGTTPYDLYEACWSKYNNILLNHPTYLNGKVRYNIGQILGMDMTRLKFCQGQNLLPVSTSSSIGTKPTLTDGKFLLIKTFIDSISDSPILPGEMSQYIWVVTDNIMSVVQALWTQMGGGPNFGDIDVTDLSFGVTSHWLEYGSYSVQYIGENLQPGVPEFLGETKQLTRQANITIYYEEIIEYQPEYTPSVQMFEGHQRFTNVTVTFTFTAVNSNGLPYDAEVEYLQSSGTQYIDTGISPHQNIALEIKWKNTSNQNSKYLFGSGTTNSNCIRAYIGSSSNWRFGGGSVSINTQDTTTRTATMNKTRITINGTNYNYSGSVGTFSSSTSIKIFAGATGSSQISTRIYYFKVWDNETLVMDLIPVRVGQTGYMYDRVSGNLFGNDGSGDFALGQDL